jgi:hypothetical protein
MHGQKTIKLVMNMFINKRSCAVTDIYLFIYLSVLFCQFVVLREKHDLCRQTRTKA